MISEGERVHEREEYRIWRCFLAAFDPVQGSVPKRNIPLRFPITGRPLVSLRFALSHFPEPSFRDHLSGELLILDRKDSVIKISSHGFLGKVAAGERKEKQKG